jgi:ankyrin repeat protein
LTSYDKSKFGLSPYDEAVQKHRLEAVEVFNRLKNDQMYQSQLKANALTMSIVRDEFDQAVSLIQRSNVNKKDIFDNTALFYAIMNQEPYLVEQLLLQDASIYAIDKMNLDAIYYAVLVGNQKIVKLLLQKQVDLNKKYLGYSVLEYALYTNDHEIYKLLKNR